MSASPGTTFGSLSTQCHSGPNRPLEEPENQAQVGSHRQGYPAPGGEPHCPSLHGFESKAAPLGMLGRHGVGVGAASGLLQLSLQLSGGGSQ